MRTLNAVCDEHCEMGPKHHLVMHRMRLARRALLESNSADTCVTEVATRYGFWQFDRFAVECKGATRRGAIRHARSVTVGISVLQYVISRESTRAVR